MILWHSVPWITNITRPLDFAVWSWLLSQTASKRPPGVFSIPFLAPSQVTICPYFSTVGWGKWDRVSERKQIYLLIRLGWLHGWNESIEGWGSWGRGSHVWTWVRGCWDSESGLSNFFSSSFDFCLHFLLPIVLFLVFLFFSHFIVCVFCCPLL